MPLTWTCRISVPTAGVLICRFGTRLPDRKIVAVPARFFRAGGSLPFSRSRKSVSATTRSRDRSWAMTGAGMVDGSMDMARASRAFKLKVSPAGFDLLVDCHTRLVRETRALLPYGTTLNVAVHHLASLPAGELLDDLAVVRSRDWAGPTPLFLGGPKSLAGIAMTIADRIARAGPCPSPPERGHVYLLALYRLSTATPADVAQTFERIRQNHREGSFRSLAG